MTIKNVYSDSNFKNKKTGKGVGFLIGAVVALAIDISIVYVKVKK